MRIPPSEAYKLLVITVIMILLFLIALDAGAFNL